MNTQPVNPSQPSVQTIRRRIMNPEWSPVAVIRQDQAAYYARLFAERFPQAAAKAGPRRIESAIQLASTIGACLRMDDGTAAVWVKSRSNPDPRAGYIVDLSLHSCTCPDSGRGNLCAHRLAVALHIFGPDWRAEADLAYVRRSARAQAQTQARRSALRAADDAWLDVLHAARSDAPQAEIDSLTAIATQASAEVSRLFISVAIPGPTPAPAAAPVATATAPARLAL